MDEKKHEEDRWRELADLLGVSDAAPPAPKHEPAPVAPAVESQGIKAYEEPRHAPEKVARIEEEFVDEPIHEETGAATIPMTREEPAADWEEEFEDDLDETIVDQVEGPGTEGPEPTEEVVSEGPPAAGEEEKPRRGRRRRRRGRRGGGPEGEARVPGAPPAKQPADRPAREARPDNRDRPADRDRRGPRGNNRRDDEDQRRAKQHSPEPEREKVAEVVVEQPAATTRPVASDTDFSDWNVPSWQDLIAALYRPDR